MNIRGKVQNGVIVLAEGFLLPEGTVVSISCESPVPVVTEDRRVTFPLVRSSHPGSLQLTGEKIAEVLDAEDASSGH